MQNRCHAHLGFSRRQLLKGLLSSSLIFPLSTSSAWGATEKADALVLSCIDFRFVLPLERFLAAQGLENHYDLTALAGGSLALADFPHTSDADAFWDQLDLSYKLHHIQKVILCDHQDCGAYDTLHPYLKSIPAREEHVHAAYLQHAAQAIRNRYPDLQIEAYFATLGGKFNPIDVEPIVIR